ncbi:hypothetical protein LINPERPRIM_LOCUS15886 [Linum perenne]
MPVVDVEDECISLSSALELVKQKGNVVERLEFLENCILQLSLELEIGNKSTYDCKARTLGTTSRGNREMEQRGEEQEMGCRMEVVSYGMHHFKMI